MAQTIASPPPRSSRGFTSRLVSYIFDIRFLGVLMQIAFVAIIILGARTLGANFAQNAGKLGRAQFICRDGSFSYRCAYDFMEGNAGFDISDPPLEYATTDTFWWALWNGIINTFRVGLLALVATTFVGTLAGIARLSDNWLLSKISLVYVEITRNTPVLIQLLLLYFGVVLALPNITEAIQPLGLPIFLSNRGLSMPWPELMSSAPIWIAFIILGLIQFQLTWSALGRRELETGKPSNRFTWALTGFLLITAVGWIISSAAADNEGILVKRASRINEFADIKSVVLARGGVNHVSEFENLSDEELTQAALHICVLRDSPSEPNFTNKLRGLGLPFEVNRASSMSRAVSAFAEGNCDALAAPKSVLNAALAIMENPSSNQIVTIKEAPVTLSIPRYEGLNVVGGWSMTGEFFALFLGLTIFYGGGLAEVVRAGILSVSKGQTEAARALGLVEGQRLQLIVLPQALKVIIPPLISTYLSLMKDTSLGVAVAFPEMYLISQTLMNQSGRALQIMIIIMVVYLAISIFFSIILNWYNQRIVLVER